MHKLSEGIIKSKTLKRLNLSDNSHGGNMIDIYRKIITENKSLEYINLKNNNIGSEGIHELMNLAS
jgi:Ran GTPase-activating protein (RanGAP) involved in mRNA processing and transport